MDNDKVTPIAIVGLGGRFPGDASDPDKLWKMLSEGRNALSKIPENRYNVDAFHNPNAEMRGTQPFTGSNFMNRNPDAFDAPFFQITPHEAASMDPQQRMCLEVAYEALENAGIRMEDVRGTQTSVYVGAFTKDYRSMMAHDQDNLPWHFATGVADACMSNRVSWFYDLRGPSMTVDTACSSSLVALHLACQSLRSQESSVSLVGGVNFMCYPEYNVTMSTMRFLSVDSKCQAFDEKANGYGRGEGCAFIVLKTLEAALRDNDVIRAVIRNTGSNQDGNTSSLATPSMEAQASLIRRVYQGAGLDMAHTNYFEAHGTGTAIGDPTELHAIASTIGAARALGDPLWVGSIKANIGHLEGASGLAGLIKALYILENAAIPAQLWVDRVNPRIKLSELNLDIPQRLLPWPKDGLRRVSVNSFGFGGANAHVILDDAYHFLLQRGLSGHHNTLIDPVDGSASSSSDSAVVLNSPSLTSEDSLCPFEEQTLNHFSGQLRQPKLIVWSAHEQLGLKRVAESYATYIDERLRVITESEEDNLLTRFAYTTAARRSILPWKTFTIASDIKLVANGLMKAASPIRSSQKPKVGFVFTGQGAQWFAMGRELLYQPVFAQSLKDAGSYLYSQGCAWSLMEELLETEENSNINLPDFSQPICTAVQVALVQMLQSWGVEPTSVVGHSSGEIAAAFAKGAITREAAWKIAYERGRLSSALKELAPHLHGSMLAAGLNETEAEVYISRVSIGRASVACVNSPQSVTFSGDQSAISDLERLLAEDNKFFRRLKVTTAYHSAHMQIIGDLYLEAISAVETLPEDPSAPKMFSSVNGKLVSNSMLGPEYWVSNMLNPVRFSAALEAMLKHREKLRRYLPAISIVDILVEIGAHSALQGPVKETISAMKSEVLSLPTLLRNRDAARAMLETCGKLFQHGYPLDLEAINNVDSSARERHHLPDLTPFPWNHNNKYWFESAKSRGHRFRKAPKDDLIGVLSDEANENHPTWRQFLRVSENPWLEDHAVHNTLLFPACGMASMVLQAAAQLADDSRIIEGYELRDMLVDKALIVSQTDEGVEVVLRFRPLRNGTRDMASDWKEFTIHSRSGHDEWSSNCAGLIKTRYKEPAVSTIFVDEESVNNAKYKEQFLMTQSRCKTTLSAKQFYDHQRKIGIQLGTSFNNIVAIAKGPNESCCNVKIPDIASGMPAGHLTAHVIHPTVLDSLIQTLMPAIEGEHTQLKTAAIPTFIESLYVSADLPNTVGTVFQTYSHGYNTTTIEGEGCVFGALEGWAKPLIKFEGIRCARLSAVEDGSVSAQNDQNLRKITGQLEWQMDISHVESGLVQDHCNRYQQPLDQLATFVRLLAHHNPAMKILDIDVGEGKIAECLLEALIPEEDNVPLFHSYTMTAVDQVEVDSPIIEVDDHAARIMSKRLDISADPLQQGFRRAEYDLVVASNLAVDSLRYVKLLLKPGAKLVIANVVGQKLLDSLIFGSVNDNLVIPVLSSERWDDALIRSGFTSIETAFPEAKDIKVQPFSFFTATYQAKLAKAFLTQVLIVLPSSSTADVSMLASELINSLRSCGSRTEVTTIAELIHLDVSGKAVVFLVEIEEPLLYEIGDADFTTVRSTLMEAECVTWVTRGGAVECNKPDLSLVTGLFRTLRSETPGIKANTLDLDDKDDISSDRNIDYILRVLRSNYSNTYDTEFAARKGSIMIPRIRLAKGANEIIALHNSEPVPESMPFNQPGRALTLTIKSNGMLDSLYFKDDEKHYEPLEPNEVEIRIKAAGLNFMDIMLAMGHVKEQAFGLECSGIVSRIGSSVTRVSVGDKVMTWLLGAFGNYARNHESMVQPMATWMTFEVAASLPMIFTTAYTSLIEEARLGKDEKILIHAAAGGVGQAAIQISQHIGAEVFATVSSEEKKQCIMQMYGIPSDHIFNSRDLSFADGIRRMTNGEGVDVVLNCLAGEAMRVSFNCLGWFGRFVELGKRDILGNTGLDMAAFIRNISYHAVNVIGTLQANVKRAARLFQKTVNFINLGYCHPVSPLTVMEFSQIEDGFRLLQNGKNKGKIVFTAKDNDVVQAIPRKIKEAHLDPNSTYVLSGGFGGIGQRICLWMAERGMKNLAVLSRSGDSKSDAKTTLNALRKAGVNTRVFACDINDSDAVSAAATTIQTTMPPVRGLVQAAMSLADGIYANMTPEQWRYSVRTKASGSWNLHKHFPKDLEFFVMLSSSSGVVGNPGQSNYAAGNTFQDALAFHRVGLGLKAVTLDLGPVLGAGHVEKNAGLLESLSRQGVLALRIEEVIALVQAAMTGKTVVGHQMPTQLITCFVTGGLAAAEGWDPPPYYQDGKFKHIQEIDLDASILSASATATWQAELSSAETLSAGADLIATALRQKLAKFMMVAPEDVDLNKPVSTYGVDSLTAVEIRAWSFRELQSDLSIFDIMSNVPIGTLARTMAKKSKFVAAEVIEADS